MCMHAHIAVRCALLYFIFAPKKKELALSERFG